MARLVLNFYIVTPCLSFFFSRILIVFLNGRSLPTQWLSTIPSPFYSWIFDFSAVALFDILPSSLAMGFFLFWVILFRDLFKFAQLFFPRILIL